MTKTQVQHQEERTAPNAPRTRRQDADAVLRDMAYVLRLTHSVKAAIIDSKTNPASRQG